MRHSERATLRDGARPLMVSSINANTSGNAMNLADQRQEYAQKTLSEADVLPDPLAQFQVWMSEAIAAQVPEPTAMTLATVGANGRPSARIVLLKGCDPGGFVFYTNYDSRKAEELAATASPTAGWPAASGASPGSRPEHSHAVCVRAVDPRPVADHQRPFGERGDRRDDRARRRGGTPGLPALLARRASWTAGACRPVSR